MKEICEVCGCGEGEEHLWWLHQSTEEQARELAEFKQKLHESGAHH